MTFADLRLPCEHGRYELHKTRRNYSYLSNLPGLYKGSGWDDCPGGRSATIEDLMTVLVESPFGCYSGGRMKVMVTGSRDWRDIDMIASALEGIDYNNERPITLIHGCASGADAIARSEAVRLGWRIKDYWPDYSNDSFADANLKRNLAMVESKPNIILAFPTRGSRGTWHAVNAAKRAGYIDGETLLIYKAGDGQ